MLGFITKVTALRVSERFASGTRVRDATLQHLQGCQKLSAGWNDALSSDLPTCVSKMSLYITSAATREIIFNPIRSNIAEAHSQIASLLEAEYESQDIQSIKLKSPTELAQLMSAVWLTAENSKEIVLIDHNVAWRLISYFKSKDPLWRLHPSHQCEY